MNLPTSCKLCPRACGADRAAAQRGICGADDSLIVARAALHEWEEPPISGWRGSGTVFFSNCPLHCVYCQNVDIASGKVGKAIGVERLAQIFLELQAQGAHNINLVSPTQYVPQIIAALKLARGGGLEGAGGLAGGGRLAGGGGLAGGRLAGDGRLAGGGGTARRSGLTDSGGLTLPIVYNTSGYETPATIAALADYIDIWLTDFKYISPTLAARYSNAPDYAAVALPALQTMVEQVEQAGGYTLDTDGILQRGVVVRHLLLPGQLEDSKAVISTVFATVGNRVCYSLMNQYTPLQSATLSKVSSATLPPELQTTVSESDYDELIDFAIDLGISNSFMQEGGAATESFIPEFDLTGV